MSHKYLNKLGISSDDMCIFNSEAPRDNERWDKQRNKYGFDDREVYNLDFTLITWLYSHLKYYYKHTPVDLDCNHYNITSIDGSVYGMNLGQAIKLALKYMERYLEDPANVDEVNRDNCEYASCALRIVAEIFMSLWM